VSASKRELRREKSPINSRGVGFPFPSFEIRPSSFFSFQLKPFNNKNKREKNKGKTRKYLVFLLDDHHHQQIAFAEIKTKRFFVACPEFDFAMRTLGQSLFLNKLHKQLFLPQLDAGR
jgi:hypothetical protein